MLMQRANLKGLPGPRRRPVVHETPTSTDLVDRNFRQTAPNRLWVTDITEHPTREGKIYCAVVLDTFSRRVVGRSIDSTQTATLVTNALDMAIKKRKPTHDTIIHSSGLPHSRSPTQKVDVHPTRPRIGLMPSMGSVGDCYDNAVIESFWGRIQTELLNRHYQQSIA